MKRTGEILRKAREAKGLSINELAISLKINSKALTAIEDGDLSKLPAKTFLRGFVQSYAQALKVDVNEVLAIFSEEMGSTRPQPIVAPTTVASIPASTAAVIARPAMTATEAPTIPTPKTAGADGRGLKGLEDTNRLKYVMMTGLALVLIGFIFGTKKIIDRYQRESAKTDVVVTPLTHEVPAEPAPPAAASARDATTNGPATVPPAPGASTVAAEKPIDPVLPPPAQAVAEKKVEAKAEPKTETKETAKPAPKPAIAAGAPVDLPPSATPSPLLQPISANNGFLFNRSATNSPLRSEVPPAEKNAKPAEAAPPKIAVNEPKSEATADLKTETKETAAAPPSPLEEKKKPKKSLELIIEAMDAVEVEYAGQGGQAQKIHLDADQVHTIRSRSGLKLTVSNGGAVNLILNGRDLGVPGGLGSPVTLTY